MSHRLYQTEGLILQSKNVGEASRLIYLLTPDLGLVTAVAQGVRNLNSKLRYHLQDFSLGEFTLVRGRDYWRLTGASANNGFVDTFPRDRARQAVFIRIIRLLFRLIQGEGVERPLFADLKNGFFFLNQTALGVEELFRCELFLVFRLLYHLGYLGEQTAFKHLLSPRLVWSESLFALPRTEYLAMLRSVNQALRHSQL